MPLLLDLLTRVRNIHWGGGTFVVHGVQSEVIRGTDTTWESLGTPFDTFGAATANSGSSTATVGGKPVFVLSALHENDDGDDGSVILASRDGKDWQMVFSRYEVNDGNTRSPWIFEPTGIVWDKDEQAFYAAFYQVDFISGGGGPLQTPDGEDVYRSTDGFNWVSSSNSVGGPPLTDDTPSALVPHCNKPANEGRIPDGLQAYNSATDTLIKPETLSGFSPINGALYGNSGFDEPTARVIIRRAGAVSVKAVSSFCRAVAYHGGLWVAACGTGETIAIDASTNEGKNWKQVYFSSYQEAAGDGGATGVYAASAIGNGSG